ncbi:MAG: asparagine synthase (glutamine-hydrolyzing) [Odoribacter sp.]
MCGFVGIFERNKDNRLLMSDMLDAIKHRGPDDKTIYQWQDCTLGHRRLSIIDLNTGNQPLFNEDKSICVIFNGEIYNYAEIREELKNKGHLFHSESDTEILVHSYEEFGDQFMERLNGIFAFAILDQNRNRILLTRDHFGVKPLHYYCKDGILLFGSEQKSIILHPSYERKLNNKALHLHLNLRYTPGEETLFAGIKRLPPAHFAIWENGQLNLHRYWEQKIEINRSLTEDQAKERLNAHLKEAVRRQLMSDVPLGVYLSGGLDSSTIVQKMYELGVRDINTFTLGFNEPTDEFPDAQQIADHFHTNHHTLSLSMTPMQQLPKVIWHAEEPKINLLQGYNMSAFVQPKVKVVLGGLGGDELLAGYDIHQFIYPFNKWHNRTPDWLQKLLRFKSDLLFKIQNKSHSLRLDEYRRGVQMLLAIGDIERSYLILRNCWDYDNGFYKEIYSPNFLASKKIEGVKVHQEFDRLFGQVRNKNGLTQVLFAEFQSKMVNDYLLTDDRMSMANSVEERVPFLDRDLVDFCFSLPIEMKIKNNQTKYLFRKAMEPYLPPKIITKKKWGFTVNPYLQFKKDLKDTAEKILTPQYIENQGIFNYNYIKRILDYPAHPKLRWHYNYIWIVLGLAIWEDMFINKKTEESIEAYYK